MKNGLVVNTDPEFVYEVSVYAYHNRYFSLCNKEYFQSKVELPIISSVWINKHTQMCAELYAAPEIYLIDEGFELVTKENINVKKTQKNQRKAERDAGKTTSTRIKKL